MTRMFAKFEAAETAAKTDHSGEDVDFMDMNGWGGYRYIMELGMPQPRVSYDTGQRPSSRQKVQGGH